MKNTEFILLFTMLLIGSANNNMYASGEWEDKNKKDYVSVNPADDEIYIMSGEEIRINLDGPIIQYEYNVDDIEVNQEVLTQILIFDQLPKDPGSYKLDLKVTLYPSAKQLEFEYDLYVVPKSDDVYTQNDTSNRLVGWRNTSSVQKPVLIVEGFDPGNQNFPPFYYQRGKQYIERMVDEGHSVFVLNLGDGGADMNDNSQVVKSAIKELYDMTNDELRLFGMSMGGVLARHALVSMEDEGTPHNVSHFISLDAPQQGAVMDKELLDYIEEENPDNEQLNIMSGLN